MSPSEDPCQPRSTTNSLAAAVAWTDGSALPSRLSVNPTGPPWSPQAPWRLGRRTSGHCSVAPSRRRHQTGPGGSRAPASMRSAGPVASATELPGRFRTGSGDPPPLSTPSACLWPLGQGGIGCGVTVLERVLHCVASGRVGSGRGLC
jgi:hypothetical protein